MRHSPSARVQQERQSLIVKDIVCLKAHNGSATLEIKRF
jgi:hypothetical protein